jgi:hypothetical protein
LIEKIQTKQKLNYLLHQPGVTHAQVLVEDEVGMELVYPCVDWRMCIIQALGMTGCLPPFRNCFLGFLFAPLVCVPVGVDAIPQHLARLQRHCPRRFLA